MEYLRIGTEYYKIVQKPSINGSTYSSIVRWKRQTILDDKGRDFLKKVKRYEGFTVVPSHIHYQQEVKGFYNKYHGLSHKIDNSQRHFEIENTTQFLKHIFGEQYEIGLDYLTILWHKPTQILPILCLVSEERSTGKTTFLNWLKFLFEENMTINKNEDFRSRFNADWSEKLIIGVDEVLLDKKEDSERIKNLSTALHYKTEKKGIDKEETAFFGKFILCSNNEDNFIIIDENEIRYWVRKVNPIGDLNPDFLEKLKCEVSDFANYLNRRKVSSPKSTRMWFDIKKLQTDALKRLVSGTKYYVEKELLLILNDLMEDYEIDSVSFSKTEILSLFKESSVRFSRTQITNIITVKWQLESKNSSYLQYNKVYNGVEGWTVEAFTKKGRHYTFEKKFIENLLNC